LKKQRRKPKVAGWDKDTNESVILVKNPVWKAFAKRDPISTDSQTSIGLASRKALYALTNGDGDFPHLKELLVSTYAGVYLAEQGYGQEFLEDFHRVLVELRQCLLRVMSEQGYSISPAEAKHVSVMLDLHEQQLGLADRAVLAEAIVESYKHTSAALVRWTENDQ